MIGSKPLQAFIQKNDTWFCSLCQSFTVTPSHIGSGMLNLCKFVEDFVALLGAMTDKMGVKTRLGFELENKQWARQVFNKKYKRKIYGLRTFTIEGYYIWRGTVSLPKTLKFNFSYCWIAYW